MSQIKRLQTIDADTLQSTAYAFPPIALGVVTAGIIVAVVTYGAASLLF